MKTRAIKNLGIVLVTLLMLGGSNLYAQRGRNFDGQGNGKGNGLGQNQICQRIPDLTEDQQNKIDALQVAHLKEMTAFRNQMNELRAKKHTLMTSDNADLKEINSVIDQMTALHGKMMKASAKHQQDVRSLLTDDQKVFFDSRPMRGHGNGRGMGNGDGYGRGERDGRGLGRGLNPDCPYND